MTELPAPVARAWGRYRLLTLNGAPQAERDEAWEVYLATELAYSEATEDELRLERFLAGCVRLFARHPGLYR